MSAFDLLVREGEFRRVVEELRELYNEETCGRAIEVWEREQRIAVNCTNSVTGVYNNFEIKRRTNQPGFFWVNWIVFRSGSRRDSTVCVPIDRVMSVVLENHCC
jgi:hypothetical protein